MHPALSVIVFTSLSGAGYGLLFLIGLLAGTPLLPQSPWFAFFGIGMALASATLGLLASTFHLGRPPRAWRAFSQWRSSWLSREGIFSLATFLPALLLGGHLVLLRQQGDLAGLARRPSLGGYDLLHGDDLCLAEDGPPLAQRLGSAELSAAGAHDRRLAAAGGCSPCSSWRGRR